MPRCKHCKNKFVPKQFNAKYCEEIDCKVADGMNRLELISKANKKKWSKDKAELKESLKTKSDWLKETQVVFNEWIRLRDKKLGCVSCGTFTGKENAGHYRSTAACPELRFDELNVHKQCEHCNTYLSANLIEYRKELIKRIGVEKVEWIEGKHEPKKYTILELIELKVKYKDKIKELKK